MKGEELNEWLSLVEPHPTPGIFVSKNLSDHETFVPLIGGLKTLWGDVERLRVLVMMPGSGSIKRHQHRVDSVVWYPYGHEIGCTFEDFALPSPKPGSAILVPANQWHEVAPNTTDEPRISVVMEVPKPNFKLTRECATCRKWRNRMPKFVSEWMDQKWPL